MPATHTFPPYTYEISVEDYIEVYYRRFPTHKLFPYIIDSEVIEHRKNEDGTETIIRKTTLDIDAPGWFKSLFNIHHSIFIEEATIDKANRTVTIKTINESLNSKASLVDTTVYSVHPENPNWCTFTQTGNVTLLVSIFGLQKKIEKFCLNLYTSRYNESRELDKKMIDEWRQERENKQSADNSALIATTTNTTVLEAEAPVVVHTNSSNGEELMIAQ